MIQFPQMIEKPKKCLKKKTKMPFLWEKWTKLPN